MQTNMSLKVTGKHCVEITLGGVDYKN